jgi:hypothetical protein
MFGPVQQSNLRIEVESSRSQIHDCLIRPALFQQWLWPQQFSPGLPDQLTTGLTYTSWIGPIAIQHHVDWLTDSNLRLILSQGIDGFHEWHWGEGWVQSRLEGASVLPLNFGQTATLFRLKQFLAAQTATAQSKPSSL